MASRQQRWHGLLLLSAAWRWYQAFKCKAATLSEHSSWWAVAPQFPKQINQSVWQFINGTYRFSPMQTYYFGKEVVQVWEYADRMCLRLLREIICPVIQKIISTRCYHLQGPQGVKVCLREVDQALRTGSFRYALRLDIRSYFASIDRKILLAQLNRHFNDPRLQQYFEQVVRIPVIDNAEIHHPDKGIPVRSSLSNFFGALYLSPLDKAFEKIEGVAYFRYQDDFLILTKTRKQFRRAQRVVFDGLRALKLKLSHSKSKISPLNTFHFLGVQFTVSVSQNAELKTRVSRQLHPRTCQRALDKIKLSYVNAAPAAHRQTYLIRWATWWGSIQLEGLTFYSSFLWWFCHYFLKMDLASVKLARGLLQFSLTWYCDGLLGYLFLI